MLPLTSMHNTISTPSPSACCSSVLVCGPAMAVMMQAIASSRSIKGKCRKLLFQLLNPAKLFTEDTLKPACRRLLFSAYQTTITGNSNPSKKASGVEKVILLK